MSRQVRHRVTAVVLGGLLLGAPLLTNGTASAEQVEGGGRQVVFAGGGVLGLSCRSTPSVGSLTVPAESTVRVVNRTGHAARLRLGGTTKGVIPDDGSTEVVFRRGTTAVLLSPDCALGDESTPVLVTATPSAPSTAMPDPIPVPPDNDAATPAAPSDSGSPVTPADGGTALPDSVVPAGRPHRPVTMMNRPGAVQAGVPSPGQAAVTTVETMPQGGSGTRIKTSFTRGTGAATPTFSGMPPGDARAIVGGVPTVDLSAPVDAGPAAPTPPPSDAAAAEPVAAMQPMTPNRPIGLLAVIAAVCAVGVAVGAIRAIVSQRASRAFMT